MFGLNMIVNKGKTIYREIQVFTNIQPQNNFQK